MGQCGADFPRTGKTSAREVEFEEGYYEENNPKGREGVESDLSHGAVH